MIRESRNSMRIENKSGRVSQVPIDPDEEIFAGDMMVWAVGSPSGGLATKITAAGEATDFIGISDHQNPQPSAGVLTDDITKGFTNIIQSGLWRGIAGAAETLSAWDTVEMVTDAQHIKKTATSANVIGLVDPGWAGATGKTVAIGDEVKVWLKVPHAYQVWSSRD